MTQPSPAEAVSSGASPGQPAAGSALAPRTRRVVYQLIALVAIPTVLGLVLAGLWVTDATRSADAYRQVGRLALLGQQVNGLAQAMENERSGTATFIADGRPAAGLPALHRQYVITDGWAARVRRLVLQLGHGYPAQTQASAAKVRASIAELSGLRTRAAQSQASALAVANGYSAAISGLFPVNDSIADMSGNSALITSVRALGSLSRMADRASQQQAILGVALAEDRFGPGALTALLTAQARQAGDLASFRSSATAEESWALGQTLASPPAQQARAVEQSAIGAGNGPLALGAQASQQWSAGTSYTVGWMRDAQQQLTDWIAAYAQSLQQNATRSAMITGGAALASLVLILLATIIVVRSLVRRLRRLDAAAPDAAGARSPTITPPTTASSAAAAGVISASFFQRNHSLLERLLRLIDSSELDEDDPERLASLFQMDHLATQMWRNSDSALVLAGHETPRHSTERLSLVDVLRAAVSEIEQYDRVILNVQQEVSVSGGAATDAVHLLAELLENATAFSPETTEVAVSGHTVRGGGALISITDDGTGMPDKQLRQLNRQLAKPSLADVPAARHMGLFAVAHLAARHGIAVRMSTPPGGGTTAEVFLPAALISLDTETGSRPGRGGEALRIRAGEERTRADEEADAWISAADLPFSTLRSAAGPEHSLEPEPVTPQPVTPQPVTPEPEPATREAVPLLLAAPVPSSAPETSPGVTVAEPVGAEPDGGLPIFESVESGYGQGLWPSDPQTSQSAHAWPPTGRPAAFGHGGERAVAGTPAVGSPVRERAVTGAERAITGAPAVDGPASPGLPQRMPQPSRVRDVAADQETAEATAAESAEVTRSRLASFQRGSRRARVTAQMNRSAKQPDQDG
jgi:signal transduction histidine kinase